jgi:hypothetical protein
MMIAVVRLRRSAWPALIARIERACVEDVAFRVITVSEVHDQAPHGRGV